MAKFPENRGSLIGPPGSPGAQGAQGVQGEQGPPGQNLSGYGVEVMSRQVGMAWWRQSYGRRDLLPVSIFAIGTSTTGGWNATSMERRWIERLTRMLRDNPAIPGGRMYKPYEQNVLTGATTGTVARVSEGLGIDSLSMSTNATWTFTVDATTGFDVLFRQGPGSGTFRVQIDSGAQNTVTPSTSGAAGRHDGVYSSPTVAAGSHQVRITATNACVINAVYARNGDETAGVRAYNSGAGGLIAADFDNSTTMFQRLGQIGPSLVPIMLGANDFDVDTSMGLFKTQLKSIISQSKQALIDYGKPPATYLLIGTYARFDANVAVTANPWSDFLATMNEVANEDPVNVAYADISIPYPGSQANDPYDVIHSDSLHQTDYGHGMMADLIYESMTATPQIVVPGQTGVTPTLGSAVTVTSTTTSADVTAASTTWVVITASGTTFVAPPSGKVNIDVSAWMYTTTAGNGCYICPRVRLGGTIGSGTEVLPLDAGGVMNNSLSSNNNQWTTSTRPTHLTGLTPGSTYNIQLWVRSSSTVVAHSAYHRTVVTPLLA